MAVRRVGPCLVARALATAPVPRPPQPTRAIWIVPDSPACTCGSATPARAEAAAILPVVVIMSRRVTPLRFSPITNSRPLGALSQPADAPAAKHRKRYATILAHGATRLKGKAWQK